MLKTLVIRNFALLAEVRIDFGEGLNILTGETGAGKSILIDALGAILGQRLSASSIRTGADSLRLEAVFEVPVDARELRRLLTEQAIEIAADEIIVVRQVTKAGRGQILANGCHITLATLKAIGALLVDIHGQNANLALLKEANQYAIVDNYRAETGACLTAYQNDFADWLQKKRALDELINNSREYAQRLDMLRWQAREIEEAELKIGEDEELTESIRRLSHAEKISHSLQEAYGWLENGSKGSASILSGLSAVKKCLAEVARYDSSLSNADKMIEEATISLQEAAYEIRDYGESMDFSPQKLDKMQNRLDVIDKLCRKYGATVAEVLAHWQKVKAELGKIENYDDDIARLREETAACLARLREAGARLTAARQQSATELGEILAAELKDLGMPKANLTILVEPQEKFTSHGSDTLTVAFSANAGELAKPLAQVASGGEISRLALAIKAVTAAQTDAAGTMVFDEIDTGIGGRTAQMVAERIAKIGCFRQVLCITHLPQIAAMADVHLYIAKETLGDSTETKVRILDEAQRINEIARMASGIDATAASQENAREMIFNAREKKSRMKNL